MMRRGPPQTSIFVLVACLGGLLPTGACTSRGSSRTTDTRSESLSTARERTAFLERYVTLHSEVRDAAFHVVYYDNSGGCIPGPSDHNIRYAVRVAPADVPLWIQNCRDSAKDAHGAKLLDLLPADDDWRVTSAPRWLHCGIGSTAVVFLPEGVVLKALSSMP